MDQIKVMLKEKITADMVRPKKGRRGRNKQNPGRKIRNPELEAYALNFVRDGILKTGNLFLHFKYLLSLIIL